MNQESNVLRPTGTSGNFVKENQTMAAKEGFASVSKIWYDKTISYDDAIEALTDQKRERVDLMATSKEVRVNLTDTGLQVEYKDGRKFNPTDHAWKQMCNWLDVPQTMFNHYTSPKVVGNKERYSRTGEDLNILQRAFSLGLSRLDEDKQFLFRTYSDGTLRAMLSDVYEIVDNTWYLEQLKQLLPGGRISHYRFSNADSLYFNVLIPDSMRKHDDGDYGGMISSGNCEIGTRRFAQFPSVFRAICMNGCIWDQSQGNVISRIHRGIDLNDLRTSIAENIDTQIPLIAGAVERFLSMRDKKLVAAPSQIVAQVSLDNKWTTKQAVQVVKELSEKELDNRRNLFGVVNAITRAGQEFDSKTWHQFDFVAGGLMNMNDKQWDVLNRRASTLDKDDLAKVFVAV